jgi:hypothetical protein
MGGIPPVVQVTYGSNTDNIRVDYSHRSSSSNGSATRTRYNIDVARGFDSKFIEAQQDEATREKKLNPALTPEQREISARRSALELSLTRARADLSRATAPAHRQMLTQAIAALEDQLAGLAES